MVPLAEKEIAGRLGPESNDSSFPGFDVSGNPGNESETHGSVDAVERRRVGTLVLFRRENLPIQPIGDPRAPSAGVGTVERRGRLVSSRTDSITR